MPVTSQANGVLRLVFLLVHSILQSEDAKWKVIENDSKLISEVELIQNELSDMESEFGNSLRETLEDGGVIGKDIISSLYLKALRKDFILFIENRSIWLANNICWNLERSEAAEHYGVVIDGIPDIQNNDLIQEIKNKVCVVVNLKILDNDLIHSRHEMGYDPLTGIVQKSAYERSCVGGGSWEWNWGHIFER